jgi:hypothetical protein
MSGMGRRRHTFTADIDGWAARRTPSQAAPGTYHYGKQMV